jgi:4'-phosphopantetheinyl transferase EntD
MTSSLNRSLQPAIDALAVPGIMIGYRTILPGDENALMPEEIAAFNQSVLAVRRASGAARIVARQLLSRIGVAERALPKGRRGAPVWPDGIVGSMSHNSSIAVAAVALRRDFIALGIDVEPAEALPSELLDYVATPQEKMRIGEDPYRGRLLFVAKEAVYKAVYPLDEIFLDHHDVSVSLNNRKAVVNNGRVVNLEFCLSQHLLAVAFLRAGDATS